MINRLQDLRGEQASERRLLLYNLYFCFLVIQAFGEAVGDLSYVEAMLIICNVRVRKSKKLFGVAPGAARVFIVL